MNDGRCQEETVSSRRDEHDALRHVSAESPCPYLPSRLARTEAYLLNDADGRTYRRLLANGFRRSGRVVYRPRCRGCSECRSTRVLVADFAMTRSMRRIRRRNVDVRVDECDPTPSSEKFDLFRRYLDAQHDDTMSRTEESFRDFLYDSPIDTVEFCYRLGDRLIGVSITDRVSDGLSSVYMFFDPDFAARSLGTYSILWEIDYCRAGGIPYYYLGYFVAGSRTMAYKARFRPNEVLVGADRWITFRT